MTAIEWTDKTWNPTVGCSIVSPGCHNCYAARMARRLKAMGQGAYDLTVDAAGRWTGVVGWRYDKLTEPLSWKKPSLIFVNSMSDLFHESVDFDYIDRVFCVMNACMFTLPISLRSRRWHTFQVLTKRPQRAAEYVRSRSLANFPNGKHPLFLVRGDVLRGCGTEAMNAAGVLSWPLANVWIGTSVEDQKRADERIPQLLDCPAALRFLSCEPLLERVDVMTPIVNWMDHWQRQHPYDEFADAYPRDWRNLIGWVISGGESGPGARPSNIDDHRALRDDCAAMSVPYMLKQLGANVHGAWGPNPPTHYVTQLVGGRWVTTREIHRYKNGRWRLRHRKGGAPSEWPDDLRGCRAFPAGFAARSSQPVKEDCHARAVPTSV